jgi:hypothetical protein
LNNAKLSANWLIFLLLISIIAAVSVRIGSVHAEPVPVQGALVEASGSGGFGSSTSDSQGAYNVTSFLGTGNYSVTVSAIGFIDTTVDDIEVTAGSETTNVDVIVPVSGGISGTVTDAMSSAPLPNVYVVAVNETGDMEYGSGNFTDSNGNYQIVTNLATGIYNMTAYFADGYIMKEITGVSVTAGEWTSNVDIDLDRSAIINGTVTDSVSSAALEDVLVYALNEDGDYVDSDVTDSSGHYTLNTDIVSGTYNVTAPFPEGHLTNTVSGVAVTVGMQYTVDIALDPSGIISGMIVNNANDAPLAGVSVVAVADDYFGSATTDETGQYQITDGLGTGTYEVFAYYGSDFSFESDVDVIQGVETSGVDFGFDVPSSGIISGRVTDAGTGDPIEDVLVSAEDSGGYGSNYTDADGYYVIDMGLVSGTYNVTVTETGFASHVMTGINVVEDEVTGNVDFQLAAAPTGRISGTVWTEGNVIPDFPSNLYMLGGILAIATIALVAAKIALPKLRTSKWL